MTTTHVRRELWMTCIAASIPLFFVAAAFQLSDGIQAAGVGVLRGAADTKFAFVVNVIGYWLVGLPFAEMA